MWLSIKPRIVSYYFNRTSRKHIYIENDNKTQHLWTHDPRKIPEWNVSIEAETFGKSRRSAS